ncbi:hypothetical protein SAMN05660909_04782 [Chitinophaga terrae (ex Kim and Jung 2007)]|jgi:hypothetical protein|uniref:Uncharacterized protein n=1 Tax=Chitinophaga terrae (ex Kim and Jung 2007) TaxID=408074 RepID=A0A1H4G0Z0_9BACT|nr:hypothetical protein [Chitinophaga terrae (ex Kim and Jung 2007)]SEB02392.1 hypothetical protein SAMN05660909_04782 [Chitinophaga terrae (ex Kim and Jung 2007)]
MVCQKEKSPGFQAGDFSLHFNRLIVLFFEYNSDIVWNGNWHVMFY